MWIVIILEIYVYFHQINALVNMALGKPVWEDQAWTNIEKWRGGNAVDGRYTNRSAAGGQCVISEYGARTATWRVDLGGVVSISHIYIYYRTDNLPSPTEYTSRMAGFFLYVSNTTSKEDGYLCFHEIQTENGTPSEDQKINCSVHGRYVIYYNERLPGVTYPRYYSKYAFYELCELEVYDCSNPGHFGPNCSIPCPINCQERKCDVNTGQCLGCLPGYQGITCDQVCDAQTFGLECSQSCGNCSNGETCHHVNGTCLQGCSEGLMEWNCTTECNAGRYGRDCMYQCSENCNVTRRCDRFTGECHGGCKAGWTGTICNQKCCLTISMHEGQQTGGLLNCDNKIVIICVVMAIVIVLTGSVLNYIYWKRKNEEKFQNKQILEISATNANKPSKEEIAADDSEQYTDLQKERELNPYEGLCIYSN